MDGRVGKWGRGMGGNERACWEMGARNGRNERACWEMGEGMWIGVGKEW